jgi:hypothetical protein
MTDTIKLGPMMVIISTSKDEPDWAFERKEEARLDAMYDSFEDKDEGED